MLTSRLTIMVVALIANAVFTGLAFAAIVYLARLVKRAADGRGQAPVEPLVTATLEPSPAGHDYVDMVVANCGATPAFDVKIAATPEIPADPGWEDRPAEWHDISLLRPGQTVASYACRADRLGFLEVRIRVSWKSHPKAQERDWLEYPLDMTQYPYQAALAPPDRMEDLATELRTLRRDWRPVLRGQRRLQVDAFVEPPTAQQSQTAEQTPPHGERGTSEQARRVSSGSGREATAAASSTKDR